MNERCDGQVRLRRMRAWAALALSILVASSLACGTGGVTALRNSDIRRAAVAYELAQRGPADELLVAFGFMEVRANLGFTSGNTVWLQAVAQAEYFERRNPQRSYIFLYRPEVEGDFATVIVERGSQSSTQRHVLTMEKTGGEWSMVADMPQESAHSLHTPTFRLLAGPKWPRSGQAA